MSRTRIDPSLLNNLSSNLNMGSNKIVSLANGTAASDAAAFGQIYTGFQAIVQATTTVTDSTTSSTFQASSLTATITPTSSSHRIKVTASGALRCSVAGNSIKVTIFRGSTNVGGTGAWFARLTVAGGTAARPEVIETINFIDSPSTTSATTYTVYFLSEDNTTTASFGDSETKVIILEEIV